MHDDPKPNPRPAPKSGSDPARKDDHPLNDGELSSSEMQDAGLGEDEAPPQ